MKRQQRCSGILSHHNYVKRQHFCSRPVCVCVWESPNRRLLCTLQSGAAPTLGPQAGGRPTEIFQRWNDTVGRRTPLEGSDSDSKLRRLILSCCFELVTLTWNITRKSKSATFPTVTFDTDMAHKFKEKKKNSNKSNGVNTYITWKLNLWPSCCLSPCPHWRAQVAMLKPGSKHSSPGEKGCMQYHYGPPGGVMEACGLTLLGWSVSD